VLSSAGAFETGREYGPFAGWSPVNIGVGADNRTRLLWRNTDGRASLWFLSPSTGAFDSGREFDAMSGWSLLSAE
jgi:hypothetical protein